MSDGPLIDGSRAPVGTDFLGVPSESPSGRCPALSARSASSPHRREERTIADDSEHSYGSIPRNRRRLAVGMWVGVGLAVVVGGLVVNLVTHSAVNWAALLYAAGFVMMVFAAYLWFRLSD